jgi:hypothetical protein
MGRIAPSWVIIGRRADECVTFLISIPRKVYKEKDCQGEEKELYATSFPKNEEHANFDFLSFLRPAR